jgi:peptidoglycan biosynthesis protein MviN/MurJ (putative lipid II flippase)
MGDIRTFYVQAKGIWWENRYRTVAEAAANIVLNYVLGKYYGVYGIVLATLISLFVINFLYGSQIVFKYYFTNQRLSEYYGSNLLYAIVTALVAEITLFICSLIVKEGIGGLFIKLVICIVVPNIIYLLIYKNTSIYVDAVPWVLGKLKLKRGSSK